MIKEQPKQHIECRFVVYVPPAEGEESDYHLVKEVIHDSNGNVKPNLRLIKDFKRDFYVTRKGFRDHESKKESEEIGRLIPGSCPQSKLDIMTAKALDMQWCKDPRKVKESPFLYGSDILSTAVLKKNYQDRFVGPQTYYSVCVFDVETDVNNGTDEILMASITMKDKVFCAVQKSFVGNMKDVGEKVNLVCQEYFGDIMKERKISIELQVVEDEISVVKATIGRAHKWMPDFLAIWNMDFDIGKAVLGACERALVDPKNIFSDPKIPIHNRFFKYKQGPKQKITASGVITPIKPAAQWHVVTCPSSFYVIDSMCVYKQIRTGKQEEPSYSLDAILTKEGIKNKLNFKEVQHLEGLKWHQEMQAKHKVEYIAYNIFDCICVELLDEKTFDLKATMPAFSGFSDFCHFNSQPRRLADKLHYFYLEKGQVIGTTSPNLKEEFDDETLGLSGWIVNLDATLVADNGLRIIEEDKSISTRVRLFSADLDISAS